MGDLVSDDELTVLCAQGRRLTIELSGMSRSLTVAELAEEIIRLGSERDELRDEMDARAENEQLRDENVRLGRELGRIKGRLHEIASDLSRDRYMANAIDRLREAADQADPDMAARRAGTAGGEQHE